MKKKQHLITIYPRLSISKILDRIVAQLSSSMFIFSKAKLFISTMICSTEAACIISMTVGT
jgi:hypothetical protein